MADVKPRRGRTAAAGPEAAVTVETPRMPPPDAPAAPRTKRSGRDRSNDIDASTLRRLQRGELAIAARIDLHGMTQARAHAALERFVADQVERGARMLLVITGKGGAGGEGVLRRMLPGWLAAGPHATRILRIEPAHSKHGGSGAWYVYLRKARTILDHPGCQNSEE
jgi:DNA-nicking Smr family endonuclease